MPSLENTLRAPRRMDASVADAMKSRLEKNNLSELGVNWIGKRHLNASASDVSHKYHIARLSDVYRGRSTLNNDTPRSVKKPPPWANLDRRVLCPIPDKKHREARWDDHYFQSNYPMERTSIIRLPFSGKQPNTARRRPASAGVRRGNEANSTFDGVIRRGNRPSSADVRCRSLYGEQNDDGCGGILNEFGLLHDGTASTKWRSSNGESGDRPREGYQAQDYRYRWESGGNGDMSHLLQERDIVEGTYTLNKKQETKFWTFVAMLVDFDMCTAVRILNDAFFEAQLASGLQDFSGCAGN